MIKTRYLLLTALTLFLISCGGGGAKQSPDFLYGSKLYDNYTNFYLKGNILLADKNFLKAVDTFQKMDSACNLSRLYIGRYVLNEENREEKLLEAAMKFASFEKCEAETHITEHLMRRKVPEGNLEEPYKSIAKMNRTNNEGDVLSYINDKDTTEVSKSRLYRLLAKRNINGNLKKAEEYVNLAHDIDRFNGWTLNLYRDIKILITIYEKTGRPTDGLIKRENMLSIKLHKN